MQQFFWLLAFFHFHAKSRSLHYVYYSFGNDQLWNTLRFLKGIKIFSCNIYLYWCSIDQNTSVFRLMTGHDGWPADHSLIHQILCRSGMDLKSQSGAKESVYGLHKPSYIHYIYPADNNAVHSRVSRESRLAMLSGRWVAHLQLNNMQLAGVTCLTGII